LRTCPTIRDYVTLLERVFLMEELQPWHDNPVTFYNYRDKDGVEVDIVLEQGQRRLTGVEVKAAATVTSADFSGLRRLKAAAGSRFLSGVVLYDGEASASFGDGLFAVPIRQLWEAQ
jgi:uncharacterized protein